MTQTRILSGLVMGAAVILAIFYLEIATFSAYTLLVMVLALHEWSKFCSSTLRDFLVTAALFVLLAVMYFLWDSFQPMIVLLLGVMYWAVKAVMLRVPPKLTGHTCLFEAFLSLFTAWVALVTLKGYPGADGEPSVHLLLLGLLMVWSADSFAYFGGRKFGKTKLAPSISPGKTREGVFAGMLGAMVVGVVYAGVFLPQTRSFFGFIGVLFVAILVSAFSVLGDLNESKLKRAAGVKDSGKLIPGHGGVMDRVDGLIAALPVFTLAWWYLQSKGWF